METDPERRAHERKRVLLRGTLGCRGHEFACHVHDISLGGAEIDMDLPLSSGSDIELDIARVGRFISRVAWQSGERMGVKFIEDTSSLRSRLERGMLIPKGEELPPAATDRTTH